MPRIIHFEITTKNPEKAESFYKDVFGWKIQKWDGPAPYWLVTTGEKDEPGIDGAIMQEAGFAQDQGVINVIGVDDVDAYAAKVEQAGGKVVNPKTTIPGIGYAMYLKDPNGLVFGIFQDDTNAGS